MNAIFSLIYLTKQKKVFLWGEKENFADFDVNYWECEPIYV